MLLMNSLLAMASSFLHVPWQTRSRTEHNGSKRRDLRLGHAAVEEVQFDSAGERIAGLAVFRKTRVEMLRAARVLRIVHAGNGHPVVERGFPVALQILLAHAEHAVQHVGE